MKVCSIWLLRGPKIAALSIINVNSCTFLLTHIGILAYYGPGREELTKEVIPGQVLLDGNVDIQNDGPAFRHRKHRIWLRIKGLFGDSARSFNACDTFASTAQKVKDGTG